MYSYPVCWFNTIFGGTTISCIFFFLFSCPAFSLLDSKSDVATVKIMLEFQGDSLNNFQLPDTVDDGSEGIMIGTKGKIIVPDDLQDLIEEDNVEDDEVFSYTEVYDCP